MAMPVQGRRREPRRRLGSELATPWRESGEAFFPRKPRAGDRRAGPRTGPPIPYNENEAMVLRFNERRATEAAARFLKLRGGRMSYLKLIKLLYLLDREALLRWGRPVTTDRYISMDNGPVVSRIYDLIRRRAGAGHRSHLASLHFRSPGMGGRTPRGAGNG